jgi:O-antigen/teichoic acid export membrane protein
MTTGAAYILRIFISNTGGVDQVGLYSAGFAIINTYVGMVFTAMSTDYYPRLSAVAADNTKATQTINQQAEITLLILAPILVVFMVFINWAIILLYSTQFTGVNGMIQWAALGMYFKAASWSIAFILLAKGASKLFFWNELITNIYLLGFNILGYKYGGLDGLGISFLAAYFVYLVQVFFLSRIKYNFSLGKNFIKIFTIQVVLGVLGFLIVKYTNKPVSYILGSMVILVSGLYSLWELNKRLDLKNLLNRFR